MYRLFFQLHSGHDPKTTVIIDRDLSKEEVDSINNASSPKNLINQRPIIREIPSNQAPTQEDLYTAVYNARIDRKVSKIVKFILLKKSEYQEIKSKADKVQNFVIEPSTVDDIVNFLKEEPARGVAKARALKNYFYLKDALEKSDSLSKEKLSTQTYKTKTTDKKDPETSDKEEPSVKNTQKDSEEDNDKKEKMDAAEFLMTDSNERAYNKFKSSFEAYYDPRNKRSTELKQKLVDSLTELLNKIEAFSQNEKIKDLVVNYIIKNRLESNPKMFSLIQAAYENKPSSVKEMSATGTGASAEPGSGEGMATKYAFGGAGGTKAKRKKGIMVTKTLKESHNLLDTYKRLFKKDLP